MIYGVKKIYANNYSEAVDCTVLLFDTMEQALETAVMAYEFELKGAFLYGSLIPEYRVYSRDEAYDRLRNDKHLLILCVKHRLAIEVFEAPLISGGEQDDAAVSG